MIDVPVFGQRDERWSGKYVGFSTKTFRNVGCTVVSLASFVSHVYNESFKPDDVNERLKDVKAFSGALLYWSRIPLAFPKLKFVKRAYNYKNIEVAWSVYIKKVPVMVEVNAAPIGAARHWVLYLGFQKQMDPWYGVINSTSKYIPTGYALFSIV
jgi:hypothetical protein